MTEEKPCKYYVPPTYSTCSICKVEWKYASCYGNTDEYRYKSKENKPKEKENE